MTYLYRRLNVFRFHFSGA